MNKRVTAIGLTAGLLAGAGAGLILEMSGSAGASSNVAAVAVAPDDTTDSGSGNSGSGTNTVDPAADQADHTARLQEVLQPLVDDGTLTQDQADKVIAALGAAGPVGGHGGPGMGRRMGAGLDTVATTLGLTSDEVRTAIQGGQTIAQLAEANGKTAQDVIDALVAEVTAHFDAEVASGEHTQADADARIAEATTQITDFVNNTQTAGPGIGGPGMGGRHGHGPGDNDGDGGTNGNGNGNGNGTGGTIDGGPSDPGSTDTTVTGA